MVSHPSLRVPALSDGDAGAADGRDLTLVADLGGVSALPGDYELLAQSVVPGGPDRHEPAPQQLDPYRSLQLHPDAPRALVEEAYWLLASHTRSESDGAIADARIAELNIAYATLVHEDPLAPPTPLPVRAAQLNSASGSRADARPKRGKALPAPKKRDHYEVLLVDRSATPAIVYLAAAMLERNAARSRDNGEQAEAIAEARATLLDPERRAAYDASLSGNTTAAVEQQAAAKAVRAQLDDAGRATRKLARFFRAPAAALLGATPSAPLQTTNHKPQTVDDAVLAERRILQAARAADPVVAAPDIAETPPTTTDDTRPTTDYGTLAERRIMRAARAANADIAETPRSTTVQTPPATDDPQPTTDYGTLAERRILQAARAADPVAADAADPASSAPTAPPRTTNYEPRTPEVRPPATDLPAASLAPNDIRQATNFASVLQPMVDASAIDAAAVISPPEVADEPRQTTNHELPTTDKAATDAAQARPIASARQTTSAPPPATSDQRPATSNATSAQPLGTTNGAATAPAPELVVPAPLPTTNYEPQTSAPAPSDQQPAISDEPRDQPLATRNDNPVAARLRAQRDGAPLQTTNHELRTNDHELKTLNYQTGSEPKPKSLHNEKQVPETAPIDDVARRGLFRRLVTRAAPDNLNDAPTAALDALSAPAARGKQAIIGAEHARLMTLKDALFAPLEAPSEHNAPAEAVAPPAIATLTFVGGPRAGQQLELDGEPATIGSAWNASLILPEFDGVAPEHARIWKHGDHFLLKHMEGALTTIGGQPLVLQLVVLDDGDEIGIGAHRLRFTAIPAPGGAPSESTDLAAQNANTSVASPARTQEMR